MRRSPLPMLALAAVLLAVAAAAITAAPRAEERGGSAAPLERWRKSAAERYGLTLPAHSGLVERHIISSGLRRVYAVLPPADRSRPAPVIVLLHGGTQSMRKIFSPSAGGTRDWIEIARENNAVLVAPNASNPMTGGTTGNWQHWSVYGDEAARPGAGRRPDDVTFIRDVLAEVAASYQIDAARIYVTGASNGGMMTYRMLIEASEVFAAAAVFVTALPADLDRLPRPRHPVPLMIYSGTADPLIPFAGGAVAGAWGRARGRIASQPDMVSWWIGANRAERTPREVVELAHLEPDDPCRIERRDYEARRNGAPVTVLVATGGGHAMPQRVSTIPDNLFVRRLIGHVCRDADGARLAWQFMSAHRLAAAPR